VFDIEIVLLIPTPLLISTTNYSSIIIGSLSFLLILITGLLHEWNEGSLEWSK
jgi:NADH-ubiquinone oxidoreductase chain 3